MSGGPGLAYFVAEVPRQPMTLPEIHTRRLVCRCGHERTFEGDDAQIGRQIVQAGWLPGGPVRSALAEAVNGIPADCPRCREAIFQSVYETARSCY